MTNATKAQIIAAANAILGLLAAFGVVLSDAQQGAVLAAVNVALGLWVALTFKSSPMRKADTRSRAAGSAKRR